MGGKTFCFHHWGPIEVEKPPVTPFMQNSMRTGKRKTLKKGRKPGAKKRRAGHEKVSEPVTLSRRRSKLGKSKKLGSPTKKVTRNTESEPKTGNKRRRTSKSDSLKTSETHQPDEGGASHGKVYQERVDLGKRKWRYEILANQVFGCAACRFIFGGCKTCQNPKFRGRNAAQVRAEEGAASNSAGSNEVEPAVAGGPGGIEKKRKPTKSCKKMVKRSKLSK